MGVSAVEAAIPVTRHPPVRAAPEPPHAPSVAVIIPAFNEERTIGEIIRRVQATGMVREIVVVDDGSTDRTADILELASATGPAPVVVLRHPKNRGKGAAIRTGLSSVTSDIVAIQDADLEYDPSDYGVLIAPFADDAVYAVYGARDLRQTPQPSRLFGWGRRLLTAFANALYGAKLDDLTTGYKVFRSSVIRDIALEGDGFEFCAEITAHILRRRLPIVQAPVSYRPRSWADGKKIRWCDGLIAAWFLVKCRFSADTGAAN
jgi:glycosyltransferase involved in cell wall biosynthesis